MKLSIVIPVYNEEDVIDECLRAVISQKKQFDEIIVVDNNSQDNTTAIAQSFNEVKVITEIKQGVAHAATRGYDEASGDLIARIDADTVLPCDWSINLLSIFADKSISAVSGSANYYDVNFSKVIKRVDSYFRGYISSNIEINYLWGANMALTKNAWLDVRNHLCKQVNIHEDFDLAIHLQELGRVVAFNKDLIASVSSRRIEANYLDFMKYTLKSPRSYSLHNQKAWRAMMPLIILLGVFYLPAKLIHQTYDRDKGRFSPELLFNPKDNIRRVDPTTNVV